MLDRGRTADLQNRSALQYRKFFFWQEFPYHVEGRTAFGRRCATGVPPVKGHGQDGRGTFRLRLCRPGCRGTACRTLFFIV